MTIRKQNFESGATGQTAFDAATGTGTQGTNPNPAAGVGGSLYGYCTAAAGTLGFNRWSLDTLGPWQFRRLIYLGAGSGGTGGGTSVNADLDIIRGLNAPGGSNVTSSIVRVTSGGVLNLRQSDGTSAAISTGTLVPTADWYRMEGFGNSINNTGQVGIWSLTAPVSNPTILLQPSSWLQGGSGLTQVQLGKTGTGTGYAGLVAWDLEEFYTGADATSTFLGPYATAALTISGVMSARAQPGVARSFVVNWSGGSGKSVDLGPMDWGDGNAADAKVTVPAGTTTYTFTRTPTTAQNGRTYSCPYYQEN